MGATRLLIGSESDWIASRQRSTGAILASSTTIEPYKGSRAALGLLESKTQLLVARSWVSWYFGHLNLDADPFFGDPGTVWDHVIDADLSERKLGGTAADDAAAASALSLIRSLYEYGDKADRDFIAGHPTLLADIVDIIPEYEEVDGLTVPTPEDDNEYLANNCEGWQGLIDAAWLYGQLGDTASQNSCTALAAALANVIEGVLWVGGDGTLYAISKNSETGVVTRASTGSWSDMVASLYPIVTGLISTSSGRAIGIWSLFKARFPQWSTLVRPSSTDTSPRAVVAYAAALMGDYSAVDAYVDTAKSTWIDPGHIGEWNPAESGWLIRAMAARLANGA